MSKSVDLLVVIALLLLFLLVVLNTEEDGSAQKDHSDHDSTEGILDRVVLDYRAKFGKAVQPAGNGNAPSPPGAELIAAPREIAIPV